MHTALPTPPLQSPLLTTCLACLAADRVVFAAKNNSLLFVQTDDVGSAAGEEMVLDVCEGPKWTILGALGRAEHSQADGAQRSDVRCAPRYVWSERVRGEDSV